MNICVTTNSIDWSLTKDVFVIIGTTGALVIGAIGLGTWRRQLQGTSQYEVAKKAVLVAYQVRDAIQAVRSPMLYLKKDEVEAGRHLEEEQRIYEERMQRLFERWADLRALSLEARVIWGEVAENQFNDVKDLIQTLRAEIWLHFWLKGAYAGPGATVDTNPERVAENQRTVYWVSDDDEFSGRISAAIHRVEVFFQNRMRG